MKNVSLIISIIFIVAFSTQQASARIWRVNLISNYNGSTLWGDNVGGTPSNPVFSQLKQPHDSSFVLAGDTLHLEGAVGTYEGISLSKKLIIIGPGYFLSENPNTSNNMLEAKLSNITFGEYNSGIIHTYSSGSQLIGVHVINFVAILDQSNILIKRCNIEGNVNVGANNSDIMIVQNFFPNPNNSSGNGGGSIITESSFGFSANLIFNNNICLKRLIAKFNPANIIFECKNNVFDCVGAPAIDILCSNFKNNIIKNPTATVLVNNGIANPNVSFNTSASNTGQLGTGNNNTVAANIASLFITSPSADGKYQLNTASADNKLGDDGTQRGAFGGVATNQYTLSGLPPIPVIYGISTSGVSDASGLPVTIKARTIK